MWILLALLFAQSPLPKFETYPAGEIFKGKPAKPILHTNYQRYFRTRIRKASQDGSNFAGHFKLAFWGCGSSCNNLSIIDEQTGAVYDLPFYLVSFAIGYSYPDRPDLAFTDSLEYNLASRLLILHGCPEEKDCASYYYEWTGTQLKLLKKIPAVRHSNF